MAWVQHKFAVWFSNYFLSRGTGHRFENPVTFHTPTVWCKRRKCTSKRIPENNQIPFFDLIIKKHKQNYFK